MLENTFVSNALPPRFCILKSHCETRVFFNQRLVVESAFPIIPCLALLPWAPEVFTSFACRHKRSGPLVMG